jgi:nucleotide-binding universal stress UspA family protein
MQMKRLLIAINEDPMALQVIETAGRLAQEWPASIVVCHIMPTPVFEGIQQELKGQRYVDQPFTYTQAEEQARAIAQAVAEGLGRFNVRWEARGRVGDPAQEIVALAQEVGADLIVIGFEGLRGLGKLRAIGSVSRAVMEQTRLPVLVVPALRAGAEVSVREKSATAQNEGVIIHDRRVPHIARAG